MNTISDTINKKFENIYYLGLDFSFSRLLLGKYFLEKHNLFPSLFCSNMNNIGLVDNCVDIVFSNHGIEPNGGQEEKILKEMLRVSNKYVFLFIVGAFQYQEKSEKKITDFSGKDKKEQGSFKNKTLIKTPTSPPKN